MFMYTTVSETERQKKNCNSFLVYPLFIDLNHDDGPSISKNDACLAYYTIIQLHKCAHTHTQIFLLLRPNHHKMSALSTFVCMEKTLLLLLLFMEECALQEDKLSRGYTLETGTTLGDANEIGAEMIMLI